MSSVREGGSQVEARSETRATPRAVDLRRGRAPEVEILASATYDFLVSLHVALATPEHDYADFAIGSAWIESARARCLARDADALDTLGRYLGDGRPGSLSATLISFVSLCPEPRTPPYFLDWLAELPLEQFAEAVLDQSGLGGDWVTLLAPALAAHGAAEDAAVGALLARYPDDVRVSVQTVLADVEGARVRLLGALRVWYDAAFADEVAPLAPVLRRGAQALDRLRVSKPIEPFIQEAMRGVQWDRPAGLRRIIFAPTYFGRPAVFYHFWRGTLTFCTPLDTAEPEAETGHADPYMPAEEMLHYFEALGDSTRLRILRLLADREMYLTELSEKLGLTKATTKHHMVRLRAAGLVTLYDRDRMTFYALRPDVAKRAAQYLDRYLGVAAK